MPALLIECQHVAVLSVRREPAPFEALLSVRCFLSSRLFSKVKFLALQVTTTPSWRRRKTRHSGEPPGGVVRSGFSTPRQNGSETNKKVRAALTRDCQ